MHQEFLKIHVMQAQGIAFEDTSNEANMKSKHKGIPSKQAFERLTTSVTMGESIRSSVAREPKERAADPTRDGVCSSLASRQGAWCVAEATRSHFRQQLLNSTDVWLMSDAAGSVDVLDWQATVGSSMKICQGSCGLARFGHGNGDTSTSGGQLEAAQTTM